MFNCKLNWTVVATQSLKIYTKVLHFTALQFTFHILLWQRGEQASYPSCSRRGVYCFPLAIRSHILCFSFLGPFLPLLFMENWHNHRSPWVNIWYNCGIKFLANAMHVRTENPKEKGGRAREKKGGKPRKKKVKIQEWAPEIRPKHRTFFTHLMLNFVEYLDSSWYNNYLTD